VEERSRSTNAAVFKSIYLSASIAGTFVHTAGLYWLHSVLLIMCSNCVQ